jgi:hypothetical protein
MFEVVKPVAIVRPLIRKVPPYIITQDEINTEKKKGVKIMIKFWEDKFNVHRLLNLAKSLKRHANFQRAVEWHHKHFAPKDDGASTSGGVKRTIEEKEEEEEEAGCAVSSLSKNKKRVRMNLFNHLEDSDEDSEEESIVHRPLVLSSDEDYPV